MTIVKKRRPNVRLARLAEQQLLGRPGIHVNRGLDNPGAVHEFTARSQLKTMLSWEGTKDTELELIIYPELVTVPSPENWDDEFRYSVQWSHGAAMHETRRIPSSPTPPDCALPANGVVLRFAARRCLVQGVTGGTGAAIATRILINCSLAQVQSAARPQVLPDRQVSTKSSSSTNRFPHGAREWRLDCTKPAADIELLHFSGAVGRTLVASSLLDWQPLDFRFPSWRLNQADQTADEVAWAVFR